MAQKVQIVGAPGFVNKFRATLVPDMHEIQAGPGCPVVSIISTEAGELLAVPSDSVEFVE